MQNRLRRFFAVSLISCCMVFAACAHHFSFNPENTVALEYSGIDESESFFTELDGENAELVINALNKISYKEVKETIYFGPSPDCLTIFIGNDTLCLYNVGTVIHNGGYITYNGALCRTTDHFKFLLPYMD